MTAACRLCGNETSLEWIDRFGVCDPCAENVANLFWHQRSGQWLTRPNPPAPKRSKEVIAQELRTRVFERDAYRCIRCCGFRDLTADHIKPESKGGATVFENLQTLCRSCNSKKGASE